MINVLLDSNSDKSMENVLRLFMGKDTFRIVKTRNGVFSNDFYDYVITDDKNGQETASLHENCNKVLSFGEFLVVNHFFANQNPQFLNIEKVKFKTLDIQDPFFTSLKQDYPKFLEWYEKKKNEMVYCYRE